MKLLVVIPNLLLHNNFSYDFHYNCFAQLLFVFYICVKKFLVWNWYSSDISTHCNLKSIYESNRLRNVLLYINEIWQENEIQLGLRWKAALAKKILHVRYNNIRKYEIIFLQSHRYFNVFVWKIKEELKFGLSSYSFFNHL